MVCARGMRRFVFNRPLNFADISEPNWDSIFRRSLVIETDSRFPPSDEFEWHPVDKRGEIGNSRKGDTLEKFPESGPDELDFILV